jgi:hypothetical protein
VPPARHEPIGIQPDEHRAQGSDWHGRTCLLLDKAGRIVSTREPDATRGPLFAMVRSATACTWAVRADLPAEVAGEIDRLGREEPLAMDLREAPRFADRYVALLKDRLATGRDQTRRSPGPGLKWGVRRRSPQKTLRLPPSGR